MESMPKTPDNFTDYERFAVEIFDGIDELFAQREVPSLYEKISDRFSKIALSLEELEQVSPLLESYAVDAPNTLDFTITGHNPFNTDQGQPGVLEIATSHWDTFGSDVKSKYTIWIDRDYAQPVEATKDVRIDEQIFTSNARIDPVEQRALRGLINHLKKSN